MALRFKPVPAEFYVTSGFGPRWGTVHRGTDFGRGGGSGGHPVFAAQAGTVVYAGAASGFGGPDPAGWVVVDHPAADGAGTTVYGHVIREVSVGQRVEAGQRIARINPNQGSNGNVAPHLHFEVHPYSWRAGSQIDPVPWLGNAPSPGSAAPAPDTSTGTTFGVDVSEHQNGMSLARAKREGIEFAIIRTTDGTYKDRVYRSHLDDAESAGMITAAYHYLRNPSEGTTVAQQVQASLEVMGDKKRPMWLDCETDAGLSVDHIREFKRRFEAAGVRVVGVYSYVPWWEGRVIGGEPDSHEFGPFWVAAYGRNLHGTPRDIYPGNGASQWNYPLGNQKPAIWQYGSNARVAGYDVDINAFRGTREGVAALFNGTSTEGDWSDMASKEEIRQVVREEIAAFCGPIGHDVKRVNIQTGADANDAEFGLVPGWNQGGNRSLYDLLAAVAEKAGVPRTKDTLPQAPKNARNPKLKG